MTRTNALALALAGAHSDGPAGSWGLCSLAVRGVGFAQALSVLLLSCFPPQVSVSLLCKLAANTEVVEQAHVEHETSQIKHQALNGQPGSQQE